MNESQRTAMIDVLTRDQEVHAANCAKILTKGGKLEPFLWNRAQRYIHERLEKQIAEIGYVRALVLKGRQQGCCYSPDMRVLTADYRWVRIGDLPVGEVIYAVDEELGEVNSAGRRQERRLRAAVVEAKVEFKHQAYAVKLENGATLVVTGEHRHLCRQRGGDIAMWRAVSDTRVGDHVRVLCEPPAKAEPSFEDGWFAGLLDGEGSFGAHPQVRIALSQVDGHVLRRAKKYLEDRGIHYYELVDTRTSGVKSKLGDKPVHCLRIDRLSDVLKLMTLTRPSRFVERDLLADKKLPKTCPGFEAWTKVLSIEPVGEIDVVDIQTSAKTFICEGLVSHNSTYVAHRFYHKTSTIPGQNAFIVAHEDKATANLFKMVKRYHEHNPAAPTTKASNAQELIFGSLDSGYKLATAGSQDVGRSNTARLFHGSEFGFWANAQTHLAGVGNTIPSGAEARGTEIILESTANGLGNHFHEMWQAAEAGDGEYIAIFVPWFWQQEYRTPVRHDFDLSDEDRKYMDAYGLTMEQMQWRANKIAEYGKGFSWLFDQEYPATAALAFRSPTGTPLIDPTDVMAAVNSTFRQRSGALVIGCDPASDGVDPSAKRDRTAIVFRQGRTAFRCEAYHDWNTIQVANLLSKYNEQFQPDAIFIDKGGIGAGIYDQLVSRNVPVHGVMFGAKANNEELHLNKRAEMWWTMKEWLEDGPNRLPNEPSLISDLTAPQPVERHDRKRQLESKKDMAKRGIRSPDYGDALALTFAEIVEPRDPNTRSVSSGQPATKAGY